MPSFIRATLRSMQPTGGHAPVDALIATHAICTVERRGPTSTHITLCSGDAFTCDYSLEQIQAALVNTDDCSIGKP